MIARPIPQDALNAVATWIANAVADRVEERLSDLERIEPVSFRPAQVAVRMNLSRSHVDRLIASGELRAIRSTSTGGTGAVLVHRDEIERYLAEANTVRAAS